MINWLGTCAGVSDRRERFNQTYVEIHKMFFHFEYVHTIEFAWDTIIVNMYNELDYMRWLFMKQRGLYKGAPKFFMGFNVMYRLVEK
jgi:hypothetical protein